MTLMCTLCLNVSFGIVLGGFMKSLYPSRYQDWYYVETTTRFNCNFWIESSRESSHSTVRPDLISDPAMNLLSIGYYLHAE